MEFKTIFTEYRPGIFRYLVRLVGQAEAEDLTQEVFLKASRGLASFRAEAKISTWLYRIATNAAVDLLRRKGQEPSLLTARQEKTADDLLSGMPVTATKDYLQKSIEHREMNACIRGLLDRVPAQYRTILLLSEVEGFTDKEISEILALSLATVKIRLHRGKEQLREKINKNCVISLDGRNELVCEPKPNAGKLK